MPHGTAQALECCGSRGRFRARGVDSDSTKGIDHGTREQYVLDRKTFRVTHRRACGDDSDHGAVAALGLEREHTLRNRSGTRERSVEHFEPRRQGIHWARLAHDRVAPDEKVGRRTDASGTVEANVEAHLVARLGGGVSVGLGLG